MTAVDVRIYEVGPRDGLQAEGAVVSTADKLRFLDLLADAGLREIEATSFVSPHAIPQLADADELMAALERREGVRYAALVPNERGLQRAVAAAIDAVCLFTAATESYVQHNINMSIEQSLATFAPIAAEARQRGWWLRAYVSTAFGCPYEGEVDPAAVVRVSERLLAMGVDELSISDTVGVAAPADVDRVLAALSAAGIGTEVVALHFHDTRGTALANVLTALQLGVTTYDSSAGGLGGCPYAPGATGNLATEDLLYMLDGLGIETGVSLAKVLAASQFIEQRLGHPLASRYAAAVKR